MLAIAVLVLFFHVSLSLFVVGHKAFILGVFQACLDVESERDGFEQVALGEFIVFFEVIEQGFFVAEVEVVGEMVVHPLGLPAELLEVELLLSLIEGLVPEMFYCLFEQILFVLGHNFVQKLFIFELFTLLLFLLFTLRPHKQLATLLPQKR